MTQDEIIFMARQAGMHIDVLTLGRNVELLESFAKLVAQHTEDRLTDIAIKSTVVAVETAMALENEACARVCEDFGPTLANGAMLAEAIRARKKS
jgi:hypothetical protein